MEKEYKGGRQKMNESREYYKSLLNEQQGPTVQYCYVCSGGTVFEQAMWGTPPMTYGGGYDIVGYSNIMTNPIALANGYEMCTMQNPNGQPSSPEILMHLMGGPSNSQGPEAVYWTTPDMPTLLCNSGTTTTATCPSVYSQGQPGTQNYWQANYITQGQLNFCAFFNANPNSTPGVGQGGPGGTMTGADLFTACGCSLTGTTTQACFGCVNGSIVDSSTNGLYYTPNPQGYCSTFMGNDYYSSPANINLASCGTGSGSGTTSATCMNIKTVQCNDPGSGGEWPCATIDGVVPDQSFVGRVIDAGSSVAATGAPIYYEITEITSSGSSPWGTQDFPEVQGGCPSGINPNSTCDFSWTSSCAQQNLNTGGQNSWDNFLTLRETGFNGAGCQHLQSVVNWNTNQLNSGVNSSGVQLNNVQISRKTEQIAWAQCQANECGCPSLNVPPLTGGPTPPPPTDPDLIDPEAPKDSITPVLPPDKKKPKKGDEKELKEQFTRMRTLWKYNKQ